MMPKLLVPMILIAAGCAGADSGPVFVDDVVMSPTSPPTTQLVVPLTTLPPDAAPEIPMIPFDDAD